jgi:DNA polymerase phi
VSLYQEVSKLASSKIYLAESASAVVLELASALGREPGGAMTAVIAASPALQKWITAPMQSGKEGTDAGRD